MNVAPCLNIAERFSRAAPTYDAAARHQARIARLLDEAIPDVCRPGRVLEWGCGTGLLTARLIARWPSAGVTAVDIASAMIDYMEKRFGHESGVSAIQTDAEHFSPEVPVDLLASNCVVQWFANRSLIGEKAAACVAPGGWLALSVPVQGTLEELWTACRDAGVVPSGALEMDGPECLRHSCRAAGWRIDSLRSLRVVEKYEGARAVLRSLGRIGATARQTNARPSRLSPAMLRRVIEAYDARHMTSDGCVPCTYEVAMLVAQLP